MAHRTILLISTFICGAALHGAVAAGALSVSVKGVLNTNGHIIVSVCDKQRFLKHCALSVSSVTARLDDVPTGRYAISVLHDENDNQKMDRNFIGIPKEGYGFSRDAKVVAGPPSFDDAAFDVAAAPGEQTLSLRY
jgi:uncharacterized protein (DUF2141 family)